MVEAVFLFGPGLGRDIDVEVFPSLERAAGWMEAIDVDNGEYSAVYLSDGSVLQAVTDRYVVSLRPTGRSDLDDLVRRLVAYQSSTPTSPQSVDPATFAREWFEAQWQRRWPKRPVWLDRRLHGPGPGS